MTYTWNKWHEAEEAKLVEMFKDGMTDSQISEQLGRNLNSVKHRVALLKDSKVLEGKRRKRSNEDVYNSNSVRIIENFRKRKAMTGHKLGDSTTKLSNENHKLISDVLLNNEAEGLSETTRANYITYTKIFALKLSNTSLLKVSLDENIMTYISELRKRLPKETSFNAHKAALKNFYEVMFEKYPDNKELNRIIVFFNKKKKGRKKTYEPEEKQHLSKREIVQLVSGIKGKDKIAIRDRAIIAALYDTGARLSELVAVRQQDAKINEKVPYCFLPISKTKPRPSHMLNFSMPYLMEWIKVHEFWNDPNAALFYSMSTSNYGEPIAQQMISLIVRKARRISKIDKKITPHTLRHTKAYHCAADGMLPSEANRLFGWGISSTMFIFYTRISEGEVRKRELERAGKLSKEDLEGRKLEREAFRLKNCARCNTKSLPDQLVCSKCGLILDKRIAEQQEKRDQGKEDKIKALEDKMEKFEDAVKLIEMMKKTGKV